MVRTKNKLSNIDSSTDRNIGSEVDKKTLVYTIYGKHDYLDNGQPMLREDGDLACAKKVLVNGKEKLFIKKDRSGICMDPVNTHEDQFTKDMRHSDERIFVFARVGMKEFNNYITFLKTKNAVYLRNAQREGF